MKIEELIAFVRAYDEYQKYDHYPSLQGERALTLARATKILSAREVFFGGYVEAALNRLVALEELVKECVDDEMREHLGDACKRAAVLVARGVASEVRPPKRDEDLVEAAPVAEATIPSEMATALAQAPF